MPMLERPISKAGWTRVAFGDVVRLSKSRVADPEAAGIERVVGLEHIEPGDLRIRRWGDVADGTTFTTLFKPGQVLFGKRRAYQRKVAVADFEGVCSGDIYVLEPANDRLMPELLLFLCQTDAFFDHAVGTSAGSLSPRTNWTSLASFEFLLPPIQEQARIVSMAMSALKSINAYADAVSAAESLRMALFVNLYRRGTVGEVTKLSPLGELPESWTVCALGERFEVQLGKRISELELTGPFVIPYMRNANVQWNRLDLEDVSTVRVTAAEREKYALREGDILACEGRHVGKAAMWRNEVPGAIYQMALHRLRPLTHADSPHFMLHCLQYYSWTGMFAADTAETTIPHLSAERFRAMLFPFPPRNEQDAIAVAINSFDENLEDLHLRARRTRAILADLISVEGF
jgi:type I restriction enzyme S subunit